MKGVSDKASNPRFLNTAGHWMNRCKHLHLPATSTLRKLLQQIPVETKISHPVLAAFKKMKILLTSETDTLLWCSMKWVWGSISHIIEKLKTDSVAVEGFQEDQHQGHKIGNKQHTSAELDAMIGANVVGIDINIMTPLIGFLTTLPHAFSEVTMWVVKWGA